MGELEELQRQLALKQRDLDMVLAIDRIRDTASGPFAMLSNIVSILSEQFKTDFCLLYLLNRETGTLELKVVNQQDDTWRPVGPALSLELAQKAMQGEGVTLWDAEDVLEDIPEESCLHDTKLAAIPIVLDEPLGTLLMGRACHPFDAADIHLLRTAESQIDSAVVQAYTQHELAQRNKELETIYRVDHIRDQQLPFDEMLSIVLQELCQVIDAEVGFVMLYNQTGKQLEMRAVTHADFIHASPYYDLVFRLSNEAVQQGEMVCHEDAEHVCSVMCVPLILGDRIIGVFGALNRKGQRGFSSDDRRLLRAIVSQMDTAILESLEQRRLRRVLSRSVDQNVLERLLANPNVDILKGERSVLSVLYVDLRGSTSIAERTEPELLVEFINDYMEKMTDVLLAQGGTLDKFVGDEVMAIFGAPVPQVDHALRAVRVGLAMQDMHQTVIARWHARGVDAAGVGVGIATGELIVGEIGCEQRTDYTVIGRAANLGARICAVAKGGQVLISQATYDMIKDRVETVPIPGQHFKGIDHPVTVYEVKRVL